MHDPVGRQLVGLPALSVPSDMRTLGCDHPEPMRWRLLPNRTEVTCDETLPFLLINDGSGLISFGLSYRL